MHLLHTHLLFRTFFPFFFDNTCFINIRRYGRQHSDYEPFTLTYYYVPTTYTSEELGMLVLEHFLNRLSASGRVY